jgi:DNA-binding FadR family transcriptional regulator
MAVSASSAKPFRGLADQIVEDLRAQILNGALADGTRLLSELELAARYGARAATIREPALPAVAPVR